MYTYLTINKKKISITVIVCVLGCLLSWYLRIPYVEHVQISSDSISPFAGATKVLYQGWSDPPNPESDHWLWFSAIPILFVSDSIEKLFYNRVFFSILIQHIAMSVLCWVSFFSQTDSQKIYGNKEWLWFIAMLVANVVLALDYGLMDTLASSFRGYWSAEYVGVATVCAVCWFHCSVKQMPNADILACLSIALYVMAMGQHPLVLGLIPWVFYIIFLLYTHKQRWWLGCLIFVVFSVPRMCWIFELMQCDQGGFSCLSAIANSSSEILSVGDIGYRILHDRFYVEMGVGGIFLLLGCLLSPHKFLQRSVWVAVFGIFLLGLWVDTLRPYHFRVLGIPMIMCSVTGWMRVGKWSVLPFFAWVLALFLVNLQPLPWTSTSSNHDVIAKDICTILSQNSSVWLEGYGENMTLSMQTIGVSTFVQGCLVQNLASSPPNTIFVLSSVPFEISNTVQMVQRYNFTEPLYLYQISKATFVAMIDTRVQREYLYSGYDIATLFYPEENIQLQW